VAIALSVVFVANPSSFTPSYKSDMRDVAGEVAPHLRADDLVISGQPEQVPLAAYYLPAGLRYANTTGPVQDPTYMNWVKALDRLRHAQPAQTLAPLLATLRRGQQVLLGSAVDTARAAALCAVGSDPRGRPKPQAGVDSSPQLPRCLLRGRQRRPLPKGRVRSR